MRNTQRKIDWNAFRMQRKWFGCGDARRSSMSSMFSLTAPNGSRDATLVISTWIPFLNKILNALWYSDEKSAIDTGTTYTSASDDAHISQYSSHAASMLHRRLLSVYRRQDWALCRRAHNHWTHVMDSRALWWKSMISAVVASHGA